jgi:predicted PurR-regulated permease PerM
MARFLLPLFLAALLVVMFRPLHQWFLARCKGRPRLAAALTTLVVMLIVLTPAAIVTGLAAVEASSLATHFNARELRDKLTGLRTRLNLQIPFPEQLKYFESTFDTLRADAAAGAASQISVQTLENLQDSLLKFEAELRASDRADLAQNIVEIRQSVENAKDPTRNQYQPGSMDYQSNILEAARQFRRFKVSLLGGEYRTRLKELANPTAEDLEGLRSRIFAGAPDWFRVVGGATGSVALKLLVGVLVTAISLHFFLADGPAMINSIMRLSPLDDRHEQELLAEFDRVTRAVVVATLLSAVVQGALAGLGFAVAGLNSVFLLSMVTAITALIPFVGASAVWIPAALYLFFVEERTLAAVLLAAYGAGIVSVADNVIKPLVLHGQSNLHPLLALLSVLGGVQALGPIGILVGPMVVAFLQTLLNILHRELIAIEGEEEGKAVKEVKGA